MESIEIKGLLIPDSWSEGGRPTSLKLAAPNELNYQLVIAENDFESAILLIGSEVVLEVEIIEVIQKKVFYARLVKIISSVKGAG